MARLGIPVFDQVPRGIKRPLIVHQTDPKRGQRTKPPPGAAIGPTHLDKLLDSRFGENCGQVIGPIAECRRLARQRGQLPVKEIAERLTQRVHIGPIAVDEIHRHIERVIDPLLKPKALFEHKRQHARAGFIQPVPDPAAPRLLPIGFAFKKRRVAKERVGHRLQRKGHAQLLHHIRLGREIEIHLDRASSPHHDFARRADSVHIGIHQLVTALWHHRHLVMRPMWRGPKPDEANTNFVGNLFDVGEMLVHFVTGLMDRLERRAREFQLPTRLQRDIGAVLGQTNQLAALFQRVPATPIAQPFQNC